MAIETRTINGTLTEAYTSVEDSYMTQAKATHFHSFWTRKILAPTESIDDFKEVTAAEKAKLEAADAAWERPPQSFIDAWNTRADFSANGRYPQYVFGKYNEATGYFELNTILDIDYAEAQEIMSCSYAKSMRSQECNYTISNRSRIRTVMPMDATIWPVEYGLSSVNVQVFRFFSGSDTVVWRGRQLCSVAPCLSLHTILGNIYCNDGGSVIGNAPKLVNVTIWGNSSSTNPSLNITRSPLLSLESINFFIENTNKPYTLLLHADAYARVTDEMFEKAAAKNITITSA